MTESEIEEIIRRARQDAQAARAGWPVPWIPYAQSDKATIYKKAFDEAMKQ
jgi:hypothetical protein